jgi:hypothetical protein
VSVVTPFKPNTKEAFNLGRGLFKKNEIFSWNPDNEDNPHLMIWGGSGSGKSFLLREIMTYLHQRKKHVHVIDLHGDLKCEGNIDNELQFGGNQKSYGINPFEFDSSSPQAGPKSQIPILVGMFKSTFMSSMGGIQELVLRQLFYDTYLVSGIDPENPKSWDREDIKEITPNLSTMIGLINNIFTNIYEAPFQRVLYEKGAALRKLHKKLGDGHDDVLKLKEEMMALCSSFIDYEFLDQDPEEFERLVVVPLDERIEVRFYNKKKTIQTLNDINMYAEALEKSQVFSSISPPVRAGVINRYNLAYLDDEMRRFLTETLAYKIFRAAQTRGEYGKRSDLRRGKKCDTFIILDEIQSILPKSKEDRNQLTQTYNRIAAEARKYGLGLIVITQSPAVFPPPMLANITKRIGLKTNASDVPGAKKQMGVSDPALFNHLQRPFTAIVSNKRGGFDPVDIQRSI